MNKCDFGRKYTTDDNVGCQRESRYLLQYSVDFSLLRHDPTVAADKEMEACGRHVRNIGFVFDPNHGIPQRIFDYEQDRERPDILADIERRYEKWRIFQKSLRLGF